MRFLGRSVMAALRGYSRIAPTQRGGYRLVRMGRKFVSQDQWRGTFQTADRTRLELDLSTYPDCCMAGGLYELDTLRLIRRGLLPGGDFVACEAHTGSCTLAGAAAPGQRARAATIEPDPQNRTRLVAPP